MAINKEPTFDKSVHTTKYIAIRDLSVVWAQAQRPLDTKWSKKIADAFDDELFGELAVTLPNGNGKYHVIDGQHRVDAYIKAFTSKDGVKPMDDQVPCHVFNAANPVEAAKLFGKLNSMRKRPQPIDLFRVAVTAGTEPEASVHKILKSAGYKVSQAKHDSCIAAVAAPVAVYKTYGGDTLRFLLHIIQRIWGRDPDAVTANMIRGFGAFVAEWPHADWNRLVDRISKAYTPGRFDGAAKALRDALGGTTADAVKERLRRSYNEGLTPRSKISPLLTKAERKLEADEAKEVREQKRLLEEAA